jgi:polyisoprenoid-binding protein YceI
MIRATRALAATLILGVVFSQSVLAQKAPTTAAAKTAPAPAPAAAAPAAATGPLTFVLDPAHTYVGFQVRHIVSHVPGKFDSFSGSVTFDPKNLATMQVAADIDAGSIDTANPKRDTHLKSADFFDVANNPKITFKSTSVKPVDATHADLTGDLMMRGVTKPVTLHVELLGVMNGKTSSRAGFEAHGTVNRQDFGINWNRALDNGSFLLSDDVDLVIQVEAMYPPPPAPPAAGQPAQGQPSASKGM